MWQEARGVTSALYPSIPQVSVEEEDVPRVEGVGDLLGGAGGRELARLLALSSQTPLRVQRGRQPGG